MLGRRGQDVLVGQQLGATSLGQYAVALDLSTMATTEIVSPVMRAVYPGYVQMRDDSGRMFAAFVRVWAVIALLAVPAAAGTACLSARIVDVVLGPKWTSAIPLMGLLAVVGALQALSSCFWPAMLTRLGPKRYFGYGALSVALAIPSFALALAISGLEAAIMAWIVSMAIMLWISTRVLVRELYGTYAPMIIPLVRPALGSAFMFAAVTAAQLVLSDLDGWASRALALLALATFGALVYTASVLCLWVLAGRPPSAERDLLTMLTTRFARRAS
jgi:O-antigen/teichoic acid export membrane protein